MKPSRTSTMQSVLVALTFVLFAGCAGNVTFPNAARAGDTVALGAGWKQKFDRNSLTVTITGADSSVVTYGPGNPAVRAVVNLYPDPLSHLVVSARTGSDGVYDYSYGQSANLNTHNDPDWWQTSIYLDLPATLPVGTAQVQFQSSSGEKYGPVPVQIIAGQGSSANFSAGLLGNLTPTQLQVAERSLSFTVQFSGGSVLPAAIQVDLTHNPDSSVGGTGKTWVANPRGDTKNLAWTDDGTNMRVMLLSSGDGTTKDFFLTDYGWKYFKFYVTGGVTGLQVQNIKAYDASGALIGGVTATVN